MVLGGGVARDLEHGDVETTKRFTQFLYSEYVLVLWSGDLFDELFQFGVSVRNGVGEEHFLVGPGEVVLELQLKTFLLAPVSANSLHELHVVA